MEPRKLTESMIMQAKEDIANVINSELNQGIPVSVMIMILESMIPNLYTTIRSIIENERATGVSELEENKNEEGENEHED